MDFIKDIHDLDCMVLDRSDKGSIGKVNVVDVSFTSSCVLHSVNDTLHQVV
jgi:hypothetical protein